MIRKLKGVWEKEIALAVQPISPVGVRCGSTVNLVWCVCMTESLPFSAVADAASNSGIISG